MLTFALLLSAGMGIIQEKLYKTHGKHPSEALYYNVILSPHSKLYLTLFKLNYFKTFKACVNSSSVFSFVQGHCESYNTF